MHLPNLSLVCATLLAAAYACLPANTTGLSFGTDPPADAATLGYTLNHFALIVNDREASMHFYGKVLGMRHVFTYQASDEFEITYMGYSHGGKNGTGYQTGPELYAEKTNIEGLLEFVYLKSCTRPTIDRTSSVITANTFSHVGLIVPDIQATESRMDEYGVKILKRVGKPIVATNPAVNAFGFQHRLAEARAAAPGMEKLGFDFVLLVEDPDGNMVEIQEQV